MLKVTTFLVVSLLAITPYLVTSHNIFSDSGIPTEGEPKYEIKKVVIDAGHGGKDPGCSGRHVREKDITWEIARKLAHKIDARDKQVEVIYTRYGDVFVPLHKRAEIANREKADLFISIHCNASRSGASGTETYVMGLNKSKENLDVAIRENAAIKYEPNYETTYNGINLNQPESMIMSSLVQNAYLNQSIRFAQMVENEFKSSVKRKSRGVKQEGFLVLYKTTMPSVLIETGFLTNSKEEEYLKSKAGQDKIAEGIYKAFKKYKSVMEDEGACLPLQQDPFEDMVFNMQTQIQNDLTNCDVLEE